MTVPVATTFRGHTTGAAHDKLFNFTGPRSRKWAKKSTEPRGLTALLQAPEKSAAAAPAPTTAPTTASVQPAPAALPLPAPVVATQPPKPAAQGPEAPKLAEEFWKHSNEDPSAPWNWDPQAFLAGQGYNQEDMLPSDGLGDAQRYQRLMPYLERLRDDPAALAAFVQANRNTQDYTKQYLEGSGTPENTSWWNSWGMNPGAKALSTDNLQKGYDSALGKATSQGVAALVAQGVPATQAYIMAERMARQSVGSLEDFTKSVAARADEVGGMGPGSIAQFAWMGGAPIALAGKGLEFLGSDSAAALAGDPEAQERLRLQSDARLEADAAKNDFGYGAGDVLMGGVSGLFGGQGSWDRGTARMGAGVEKMRTMGTAQNRINLEHYAKRKRDERTLEAAQIAGTAPLSMGHGGVQDFENAKRRRIEEGQNVSPADRAAWAEFENANKAPYRNLLTGDPFLGETSAIESGKASRKWSPSEWGGIVKDWLTDGDSSHGYMMSQEDGYFDQPGAGRYSPYQQGVKLFQQGRYDPRSADTSHIPIADAGEEYGLYDPRRWLGWRRGAVEGVDPAEYRKQWDKQHGAALDKGLLSEHDLAKYDKGLNAKERKVLDFDNRRSNNWAANRGLGDSTASFAETPWAKTGAERWAKAANGYQAYEDKETARSGYTLDDYRRYQIALRKQPHADLTRGRLSGTEMSGEEEDYGQGLWERWNKYGPGRRADNAYAPFNWAFSQRDRRAFDPVLQKHREAILEGRWAPGMQVEPLIEGTGMGWSNPLGPLGERLGFTTGTEARKRQLGEAIVGSKRYQDLKQDLGSGKLSLKDFFERTRGTPSIEYDKTFGDSVRSWGVNNARNQTRHFANLIKGQDAALNTVSPYAAAAGM